MPSSWREHERRLDARRANALGALGEVASAAEQARADAGDELARARGRDRASLAVELGVQVDRTAAQVEHDGRVPRPGGRGRAEHRGIGLAGDDAGPAGHKL